MAQLYNKCSKLLGKDSGKDKKDDGEENDGKGKLVLFILVDS